MYGSLKQPRKTRRTQFRAAVLGCLFFLTAPGAIGQDMALDHPTNPGLQAPAEVSPLATFGSSENSMVNWVLPWNVGRFEMGWRLDPDSSIAGPQRWNLSMAAGFGAGSLGEFALGLRVDEVPDELVTRLTTPDLAEDPRETTVGFSWAKGDFRGSLSGEFTSTENTLDWLGNRRDSAVDVNVSWTTPWQGILSVGARENMDADNAPASIPDHILGPIPYVRFETDL